MGLPCLFVFENNYFCLMTHFGIVTKEEQVQLHFHSSTDKRGEEKMPLYSSDDVHWRPRIFHSFSNYWDGLQERKQMGGGVELIRMRPYRSCIALFKFDLSPRLIRSWAQVMTWFNVARVLVVLHTDSYFRLFFGWAFCQSCVKSLSTTCKAQMPLSAFATFTKYTSVTYWSPCR